MSRPPLRIREQIDQICDEFELALRSGQQAEISEFAGRIESDYRDELICELSAVLDEFRRDTAGEREDDPALKGTEPRAEQKKDRSIRKPGSLIARFEVIHLLGSGSFADVYLAYDPRLKRKVAVKLLRLDALSSLEQRSRQIDLLLRESQHAARLTHPGIVTLYESLDPAISFEEDPELYIVQEYVEGSDLRASLENGAVSANVATRMVAEIADAIGHAHVHGLVHRDIKPENILLGADHRPRVADFGLALDEAMQNRFKGQVAGSPAYMSPEQIRGESHLLDGRSDIWSLGVILYEMLSGERPFKGTTFEEVQEQILSRDPKPLTMIKPELPRSLERICQRCLSKQASDRYSNCADLASDLRNWEAGPPPKPCVVPNGLQAFGEEDSDFFLDLLPGPCDVYGIPESIRFWKSRIENISSDDVFRVGLLYGPSGCGKSSLVRAGLLPRLDKGRVLSVCIESTGEDAEVRLLKALRRRISGIPDADLPQLLKAIRGGQYLEPHRKLLMVFDQFEQWLHVNHDFQGNQLVDGLRQCDGDRVQALILVRDDFWRAVSLFLDALGSASMPGYNTAFVDLFDPSHARDVLLKFGDAFGRVEPDREAFVNHAVEELTIDGKVVSVRLALLAEMVKDTPWRPDTLKRMGGTAGIGVSFLEQNFSTSSAPQHRRIHERAARRVLHALVPEDASDIKGSPKPYDVLLTKSGYERHPSQFQSLIHVLNEELRLITPTDPENGESRDNDARFYQLTHDYLVHSIERWIQRGQSKAERCLEEASAIWNAHPSDKHLPSMIERAQILRGTRRAEWTEPQKRMMRRAFVVHSRRQFLGVTLLGAAGGVGWYINGRAQAANRVTKLLAADTRESDKIHQTIRSLDPYRIWANPLLREQIKDESVSPKEGLHASLGLLPSDPEQITYLKERLFTADFESFQLLRMELAPHKEELRDDLRSALSSVDRPENLLPLASASAQFFGADEWDDELSRKVADALANVSWVELGMWQGELRPARLKLIHPLLDIHTQERGEEAAHTAAQAEDLLAAYVESPEELALVASRASPALFRALLPKLHASRDSVIPELLAILETEPSSTWPPSTAKPLKDEEVWRNKFRSWHGMLDTKNDFAFCVTMPLKHFEASCSVLSDAGFRATRLRPYRDPADQLLAAAVWTRDGIDSRANVGVTEAELRELELNNREKRYVLEDVAGYSKTDGEEAQIRFTALWKKTSGFESRKLLLASSYASFARQLQPLNKQGFVRITYAEVPGVEAPLKHCGIWETKDAKDSDDGRPDVKFFNGAAVQYDEHQFLGMTQKDFYYGPKYGFQNIEEKNRIRLSMADSSLEKAPNNASAQFTKGLANYRLGNYEQAAADLKTLASKKISSINLYPIRCPLAICQALCGDMEEAHLTLDSIKALLPSAWDSSETAFVDAVVNVMGSEPQNNGMHVIDDMLKGRESDGRWLLNAARACAAIGRALSAGNPERSGIYLERSGDLLGAAKELGFRGLGHLLSEPEFAAFRSSDDLVLRLAGVPFGLNRYATIWTDGCAFESRALPPSKPSLHRQKVEKLVQLGFRPVAVGAHGEPSGVDTTSIWLRPSQSPQYEDRRAQQLANAAVCLLYLRESRMVWPLLNRDQNSKRRYSLTHSFERLGVSAATLFTKLADTLRLRWRDSSNNKTKEDNNAGLCAALILALGDYSEADCEVFQYEAVPLLHDAFQLDVDPEVHSASEWLLREWGHILKPSTPRVHLQSKSNWFFTDRGETMIVIEGRDVEFQMGASCKDPDRNADERLRLCRVPRRFAIASKPITCEQYQEYLEGLGKPQAEVRKEVSEPPDYPIGGISWHEAAAFCNALSIRDGLKPEDLCFARVGASRYQLAPSYLHRRGWRLPTEAEFELACRAGGVHRFHFGDSAELLGKYATYESNSSGRPSRVGARRPNQHGLFDIHGNITTWCMGPAVQPSELRVLPEEDSEMLPLSITGVIRGGAFLHGDVLLRAAARTVQRLDSSLSYFGFRLVKTLEH